MREETGKQKDERIFRSTGKHICEIEHEVLIEELEGIYSMMRMYDRHRRQYRELGLDYSYDWYNQMQHRMWVVEHGLGIRRSKDMPSE